MTVIHSVFVQSLQLDHLIGGRRERSEKRVRNNVTFVDGLIFQLQWTELSKSATTSPGTSRGGTNLRGFDRYYHIYRVIPKRRRIRYRSLKARNSSGAASCGNDKQDSSSRQKKKGTFAWGRLSAEASHSTISQIGIKCGSRGIKILPGKASDGPAISSTKEIYHIKFKEREHQLGIRLLPTPQSPRRSLLTPWMVLAPDDYSCLFSDDPGQSMAKIPSLSTKIGTDRTGLFPCHSMAKGYKANVSIMEAE